MAKETKEQREARKGGENELAGSRSAARIQRQLEKNRGQRKDARQKR